MPLRRLHRIATAALLAFLVGGCAGMADPQLMFRETQRRYTQLMRFSDFERAGRFVAPESREDFRTRTDELGDLRFTDYEIRDVENGADEATVRVEYVGYRASSPVTTTYVEEQLWERQQGVWTVRPILAEKQP